MYEQMDDGWMDDGWMMVGWMMGGWMMGGCTSVCCILTLLCFRPAGRRHVVVGELHSLRLR